MPDLILVNENDQPLGRAEKIYVHERGLLHRAFSVFVFNSRGELLLQKRAGNKYHSAGLWSNSACGHFTNEDLSEKEVETRLLEEMGLQCPLREIFAFHYQTRLENGLMENEIDHVFIGRSDVAPRLNSEEASDFAYVDLKKLRRNIKAKPKAYTAWLKIIMAKYARNTLECASRG